MKEAIVNDDLRSYSARNVFGVFTRRTAITGFIACVVAGTVTWASIRLGFDVEAAFALIVVLCAPIGAVGLVKVHELNSEKWIPLEMAERRSPAEMVLSPAVFQMERERARTTGRARRAEKRRLRAVAAEVSCETETQPSPMAAAMGDNEKEEGTVPYGKR